MYAIKHTILANANAYLFVNTSTKLNGSQLFSQEVFVARRAVHFIFINKLLAVEAPILRHVYFRRSNGDLNSEFFFVSLKGAKSFNRLLSSLASDVIGELGLGDPDSSDQNKEQRPHCL